MTNPPPPDLIFQTFTAYQSAAALETAIELDLFTAIAGGRATAAALADHVQASVRGVRSLADFLVVQGFLTKSDDCYALTDVSASYLDRDQPGFLGGARVFLGSTELRSSFAALTAAVRRGGAAYSDGGTTSTENPVWVDFARAMEPMIRPVAGQLADLIVAAGMATGKVLDVAAGHGRFGLEIAHRDPSAQIYGLDWPRVLDVASENAAAADCAARYQRIEGSAFDVAWGEGFDLVLIPNFLHHFDPDGCVALLRKARAALADGGVVVVLEIVPHDSRVEPAHPAAFSLIMLATTPSGDAYTVAEYSDMFASAGFANLQTDELMAGNNTALLAVKS